MGWTKDEVDKYVAKVERNIDSTREKNLKGFAFARLYREARDNVKAKRHLEAYLSVNESDFRGHRMMGQLFEETGNLEKALLSYRRSLDLNNTQHDLVLKVVELYCQVPVDPGRARAWADRAARLYPGHTAVFKLRMHLLESVGKIDYEQMEDLISEEMTKRPRDVKLHIRLIKVYAATGRLVEAYSHCASVVRTKAFDDDQEWWMCAVDVFEKYMAKQDKMIHSDRDIGPGHVILDSHAHLMAALLQLLNLFLKTEKTRETINLFYRLDHCLTMAHERKVRSTARGSHSQKYEWDVVLTEMRGQLYLHYATLILKLAKENYLTWPRALKLASVCYTTCAQVQEPDITTPWVAKAPKNKDALRWYHMACYRLSHAGHLLVAVIHKYGEEWLDNCISDWCTQQGQEEILNTVYGEHRDKSKLFLANDEEFFLLEINLPSVEQLVKYDEVCVGNNPRNLELITWIGLHWYHYERSIRPGVGVIVARIFDGLRMDVPNIEQTAADTLCLRDLEAFVYAVIRTSAAKFLEDQDLYIPDYQPQILPQQLCDRLTSPAQEEWWLAAYNLYAGAASVSSAGRVRATVQRGLEVIRALGVHGLHVRLLIYLAFNFGDKASYLKTSGVNPWYYEEHWKSLQARSLHYWKEALILLEKIERNENIPVRKDSLFPLLQNSLMKIDIKFNIQKARLILGEAALREGKIEEAMEMFEQVKTTQGMWNLAQIYKYLANVEAQAAASEDLGSDAQSGTPAQEYYNCLNKARELLLACLDKVPSEERRRQTLQDELNDIEDMLNEDPNRAQANPRKQLDFRQLDFQASRSSTTMSDVQESEDNFWLEQPQDASSKDLIAKLSEVTLNNGYLQEQMAVRDQHLQQLNNKVHSLETELRELKRHGFSGFMSPTNYPSPAPVPSIPAQHNLPLFTSPVTQGAALYDTMSTTPTYSRQQTPQNGRPLESTPVAKPSVKSRLGPRIPVVTSPEPTKIDSKFFAGLSQTNSPEKKSDLQQSEEGESEQGSVRHDSTSFDDGIHFEPIIPLPKRIEKKTGEEGEVVLFNKRAKLYRYDKDLKSWKERGTGNLKILSAVGQTRFRILMRREHILKICANHLITTEMELKPLQAGSQNTLVWNTAADFADETPNVEQLAVRFKLTEETAEFKAVFENCKTKLSGVPTSPFRLNRIEKAKAGLTKEPGSWECGICSKSNLPNTFICAACGANNTDNSAAASSATETDGALVSVDAKSFLFSKFLPKAGSWECTQCLVVNEENEAECAACGQSKLVTKDSVVTETNTSKRFTQPAFQLPKTGFGSSEKAKDFEITSKGAPNVSFEPQNSAFNEPSTDFSSALPQGNEKQASIQEPDATQKFPFEFNPAPLKPEESEETSFKRGGFGQKPTPFSFSFKPSTSSSSPLTFSFGETQAPSFTLAPFGVSTTTNTFSQVNTSSSPIGLSFGSPSNGTSKSEEAQNKDDPKEVKTLTFSASPSNALPGFDTDNDNEEEKDSASGDAVVPNSASVSSERLSTSQQTAPASSSVLSTIPPQLFWQQQLEEKFRFGNLHKTEPLAGMAPAVVTLSSGKPDAMYPASFILSKLASKSASASVVSQPVQGTGENAGNLASLQQIKDKSMAHGLASKGPQPPDLLMSLLQSKPRETLTSSSNQLQGSSNFSAVTPDDSSKTSEELDDYSDDVETESEESGSYHSSDEYDEEDNRYSNGDDLNNTVVSQPSPTTHQLLPQGQNLIQMPPLMSITPGVSGRKFLTARSPLKKGQPKNDECFVIYEIRATMADRDKASRLLLPLNFFYHARTEPCPGCLGCDNNVRLKMKQDALKKSEKDNMATTTQLKPEDSAKPSSEKENHIFGTSLGAKPLSFASFSTTASATFEKKDATHLLFPMAGQQLFGSPVNDASDETDIYFKPLIPLPELIKVTTGEEDHTLLFSERARLYRFDASASMWKERGIGDIKLLLDNKTGRGRVVMRREQVHKLCANHWITEDMELRTNSTSDRSWVWQTLADFSEETPSQEKLAVRFKSPEIALKFKDEFDDLVALAREKPKQNKKAGKTSEKASEVGKEVGVINEQASVTPSSTSTTPVLETPDRGQSSEEVDGTDSLMNKFKPKAGAWECKACLIQNNPGTTACVACNTPKPGQTSEPALNIQTPHTFIVDSSQSSRFSTPKSTTFQFGQQQQPRQADGIAQSKALEKPVFTIGRGDAPEEELEEETYRHSPSKTSPNKTPSKTTPTSLIPPTSGTSASPVTGFAFGSLSHTKFNFRLELSRDKEPLKNSLKSPQSPTSPESPGTHPEAEDDNIHFEPIIPLPKKITKKTGEENEEVLFCQRAKLYRFDKEGNQWKERGLGDIKILRSTSSGKCRVVMRRDIVLKLCTNHQITPEMTLKPNAGSEKSWVWNTLADFADEVPKQETLAVRFKTAEVALSFKDAFEKGKEGKVQPQVSEGEGKQVSPKEDDSTLTQKSEVTPSKQSTEDKELHDKSSVAEKSKDDIEKTESKKEEPQSSGFLFGSSNISSLSFASIASNIDSSPGILGSTKNKEEFKPGVPLFSRSPAHRRESEGSEGEEHYEDGPHFEPLVSLPEKVEVRTGEEEEELIFSHRAKLYRFDLDLKQWKERGVGDIKILLHKKNSRVRILMRRDHILKICANHYVTPDMTLNPNGTSTKSWVWNTLADFSDEEVKAEQLAVRFKHEETAREFKEKFDKCQDKLVQHKSEVDDKSNTTAVKITDDSQQSIVHKEEKDKSFSEGSNNEEKSSEVPPQKTMKDSFMDKFKTKPGSWECEVCLVPNNADSTSCAACSSPKPGADTSQAVSSTQSKPALSSFGGPEATGFSFGQNISSVPVSFGDGTFGVPATDTSSQKPQIVFGNDTSQAVSSTQSKPAPFSFGGPEATGFTFGQNISSAPVPFGGITFGVPATATSSQKPQLVFGNESVPKEDTAAAKPPTTNILGFAVDSTPTQVTKKDSLMDKFKTKPGSWECEVCLVSNNADSTSCAACSSPKPGADSFMDKFKTKPGSWECEVCLVLNNADSTSCAACSSPKPGADSFMDKFKTKPGSWECEVCLVLNNADSTSCAACSSPKPGADTSQAVSSTQSKPALSSFGEPEATGFSFGQNISSVPVSFGDGTFGVPATDTSSQKPQIVFGNASASQEDTAAAKPPTTSVFGFAADSSKSASKVLGFPFGVSSSDQTTADTDSVSSAVVTEAVIQPRKESKTEKAEADSTVADETREQDTVDLALTSVVEPSEEEKRRARSLLLPEGFFLYERQPHAPSSVVKAKTTSPDRLPVESKITTGKEAKKSEEPKTVFGSSSGLSFSSFSDVSTDKGFQFGRQKSSKGFAGQGTQLFNSSQRTDEGTEDDQDIYFKPLVSLSEIEVVTGEENEEKLFGHRAKLYRFESSVSQWKERGVGNIKILKNKNNNNFRVVMRRDQIHKLCANHVITTDMNLVPNAGNDRSWVWYTLADLSENEPTAEKLAVRFKSLDTAKDFKKVFEECQNILRQQKEESSVSEVGSTSGETDKEAVKEPMKTSSTSGRQGDSVSEVDSTTNATDIQATGELHQVSKSSNEKEDETNEVESSDDAKWECGSCHVSNNSSNKTCPEIGAPREGDNGEIIKREVCDTEEKKEPPEPDSTVSEDKDSSKPDQSGFLFGTQSISSLSFSDIGKVGSFGQAPSSSEAFSFKGLNDQKPVEEKEEDDDHDDEYHHDVSGDHIHFEPIIALPEKIKAVTGEENEEVVFKERAKLYRYDKELKQWKERGVGEIKILTGKGHSRIVMRRDHIHKLCANHLITIDMSLTANNSDRSWIWQTLADISEEQPKEEMLAVRFKTAENAQEFKKKFEECRDTLDSSDVATVEASDESSEKSSEEEEPSLKENEEKGIRDHQESASERTQEVPSSSTLPLKEAMMPTDSTQLVAGSLSTATQDAFRSFSTVKKEVKQFNSTTTSVHRTEQSVISNSYQEQNVVQSDGMKIEESRQMASFALQEKKITSSGEENPFQSPSSSLGARGMMQPSIFNHELFSRTTQPSFVNHELMSRQGAGLFGRQPVFPTPSLDSTNQIFGARSFTDQPDSSQVPDSASMNQETGPLDVQHTETRSVEMTQNISSSVVTSSESKTISCSPEMTKMLQEIQDKDQNNIKD